MQRVCKYEVYEVQMKDRKANWWDEPYWKKLLIKAMEKELKGDGIYER